MKVNKVMQDALQWEMFPDRSTVGQEIVVHLLAAPNADGHSTEGRTRPSATAANKQQRALTFGSMLKTRA